MCQCLSKINHHHCILCSNYILCNLKAKKTKQNKTKQNKTKQNKTKQNKINKNKTKQKTKKNSIKNLYNIRLDR
jgi:hypothetical protein